MPVNFEKAFGVHDDALLLFERRNQLITENIVNADTPDYKARDLDFEAVLQNAQSQSVALKSSHQNHINLHQQPYSENIEYREVDQSAADGNTVDLQKEKAAFAENAIRYQVSLQILSRKISGLKSAFKGE